MPRQHICKLRYNANCNIATLGWVHGSILDIGLETHGEKNPAFTNKNPTLLSKKNICVKYMAVVIV